MIEASYIEQDIESLIEATSAEPHDTAYRELLTASLRLIGYEDADIKQALDRHYKVN